MMPVGGLHDRFVFGRRVQRLATLIAPLLPESARVLDVGCGDGSVAAAIMEHRPDVEIRGVDVLVRPDTRIPVEAYDGVTLPHANRSFDAVCFVDVLHHTDDPGAVLTEAARVAASTIIVKDHVTDGFLAEPTLRLMDWAGNARHGVRLPYNYLSEAEWREEVAQIGHEITTWTEDLAIYAKPLTWWFDRSLHVLFTTRPEAGDLRSEAQ